MVKITCNVIVDLQSSIIFGTRTILEITKVSVSAEFPVAYALSKAIRVQRLALDAAGASFLERIVPSLATINVHFITDACVQAISQIR